MFRLCALDFMCMLMHIVVHKILLSLPYTYLFVDVI